jgi:predicted Zn-dependent protease
MKKNILLVVIIVSVLSCNDENPVTNPEDYTRYLQPHFKKNFGLIDSEIQFWEKRLDEVRDDIVSQSKIASLLEKRFFYSGNIHELHQADSLYKIVNRIQSINSSATFRALAANCIKQHKFQQAQLYIDSALALGDDKYLTVLLQFDIAMELGNKYKAIQVLKSLANKNEFDYLVRAAKYNDQVKGELHEAITLMEKALEEVRENKSLYLWTKANLGDMYGHANRIQESYQCYLDVLSIDPEYYHALKGIAWIIYSHEKNIPEARKIIAYLQRNHPIPDYNLLLAEMAEREKDNTAKQLYLDNFITSTRSQEYGDMYNKYVFELQANEWHNSREALTIAEKEVQKRPTAEAYSWLAWAYMKTGNTAKALQTIKSQVERKSYEPEVLYRIGMIYKAAGNRRKAKRYLFEAKSSSYELGPVATEEIINALQSL